MSIFNSDPNSGKGGDQSKGPLIAIFLCVIFYLGWNQYLSKKYPTLNTPPTQEEANTPGQATPSSAGQYPGQNASETTNQSTTPNANQIASSDSATLPPLQVTKLTPEQLVVDTADFRFEFDQDLGSPKSLRLKNYKESMKPDSAAVEVLHAPLVLNFGREGFESSSAKSTWNGQREGNTVSFSRKDGDLEFFHSWILPAKEFAGEYKFGVKNNGAETIQFKGQLNADIGNKRNLSTASFFNPGTPGEAPRFLWQVDGSDSFKILEEFCKDTSKVLEADKKQIDFFGFDHHYFAVAFLPSSAFTFQTKQLSASDSLCFIRTKVTADFGSLAPGASQEMTWKMWFGPKEVNLLSSFSPKLKTTLGLGWVDMIAQPLLLAIKGFYNLTGNYGVAIIILTILLKVLFYPLARQAAIGAAKMKKLGPEMAKIKEKYKDEPQKIQMETMRFMQLHKINPMKGCLPILPTIPVFFALFRVLSSSIELRHAPFFGWIMDLSAKDPYFVSPILLTVGMFIQQKLTPMTGMDPTQEKIMLFMPVVFGLMMVTFPSGLVIYMLTNTVVSILQQHYLNKKLEGVV
jgi:YidC/Oxa1 family membrane protein insertase